MEKKVRNSKDKTASPSSKKSVGNSKPKRKTSYLRSFLFYLAITILGLGVFLQVQYGNRNHAPIVRSKPLAPNFFINKKNLAIYTTESLVKTNDSKAVILFVHGFGE